MNRSDLRLWRHAKGFTQEQAADWLGLSWRHYQRLEAGERPIMGQTRRLIERG